VIVFSPVSKIKIRSIGSYVGIGTAYLVFTKDIIMEIRISPPPKTMKKRRKERQKEKND
jgi:hypothetical protein